LKYSAWAETRTDVGGQNGVVGSESEAVLATGRVNDVSRLDGISTGLVIDLSNVTGVDVIDHENST
jgi:hypothetical protein